MCLIEQNECWYLWVVVGSSGAAGSAGSLCAGFGPAGAPEAPLEWAGMSRSQTVCSPEGLFQSGSSYTGEQAWTHTGRSEREREDEYMTYRERGGKKT